MSTTLSALISSCREIVGDGYTSNLARVENLNNTAIGNSIGSGNTIFNLVNFPVSPGNEVAFVVDGVTLGSGAWSCNEPVGIVTFNVAPVTSAYATYYFLLFGDPTWTEFITWAVERANLASGQGMSIDVPNIPEGLLNAVKTLAAAAWCTRMAAQTGLWYVQKLQEREEDRDGISNKFKAQASALAKDGVTQIDDYYKGGGTQFKASAQIVMHPMRAITPYR